MGNWNQGGGGGGRGGSGAEVDANMGIDRGGSDNNDNNGRESYTDRFGGTSTRNFNLSDNTPTTTDDFFQGTFDAPGEPGFSGPSYSGQFGYDSSGNYYGPGDVDVTGPYSPVSRGTRAPTPFDVALGRTPPRPQSPTPGFPSLINMVEAQNRNLNTMSVGDGFEQAPVYSRGPLVDTGRTVAGVPISAPVGPLTMTRGPVYAGTNVPTQVTSEMAQDILTATGSPYASLAYDRPREPNLLERVMGFDEGYVLSPERVPGTGIEVSTVTDSKEIAESAIALSGITTTFASRAMFGDINVMDVQSLVTGEEGVYTDIGGLVGAMTNTDGRSIAFGDDRYGDGNTNNGSSGDTYVSSVPTPGPTLARRFRSRQTFSPIRSMRFPSAPAVSAPSPRFPAAEGGYIDTDYVSDGILNKKRGFHSFSVGGRAFVVAPDINNPVQYKAYGGTIEEAKNAMGGVFGYDPQTINFGKFPGEQGFGEDLQNFQPGVGGTTVNGQFVSSIGEIQQPIPMAVGGPAGFVGDRPENVPEQKTVAADVPMDVPEGTFVLSASAAEHMGSKDVENMLNEAKDVLKKAGVDISSIEATMTKEVPLAVSVGEVIIPPVLAKIIGYDRLEKINNRGKAEVERRQQNQSSPIDQQMQQVAYAAEGIDTRGMIDLEDVVNYRDFKNPQSSFMNMIEVTGAGATGNLEAMEKAFSYSRKWNQRTKSGDEYEDSFRHTLVGGLYGDVGSFYADAKENFHKYAEAYPKIGYEKAKGMLGGQTNQEQIDIARSIIAESDVDLNNNAFGRELRKQIPDEEKYVRTVERMMNIAVTEGIDKVPSITTEDGEQLRLQLSTVPAE